MAAAFPLTSSHLPRAPSPTYSAASTIYPLDAAACLLCPYFSVRQNCHSIKPLLLLPSSSGAPKGRQRDRESCPSSLPAVFEVTSPVACHFISGSELAAAISQLKLIELKDEKENRHTHTYRRKKGVKGCSGIVIGTTAGQEPSRVKPQWSNLVPALSSSVIAEANCHALLNLYLRITTSFVIPNLFSFFYFL